MEKLGSILREEGLASLLLRGILFALRSVHDPLHRVLERRLASRQNATKAETAPAAIAPLPAPPVPRPVEQPAKLEVNSPESSHPQITFIMEVLSKRTGLPQSLTSLLNSLPASLAREIILLARDKDEIDVSGSRGVRVIYFSGDSAKAVNEAAGQAQGGWLCFLDTSLEFRAGWMESLLKVMENPRCGIAAPRVLMPDGRLRDAGWVVWRDGQLWAYGFLDSAAEPEYNYLRVVDFCLRPGLLMRRAQFEAAGGLKAEFNNPMYQDAHLGAAVRRLGYTVVFQPKSAVVLARPDRRIPFEAAQWTAEEEEDRQRFLDRWEGDLREAPPASAQHLPAASRRRHGRRTLLVVDTYLPFHDREAGSLRLFHILEILRGLDWRVLFLPQNEQLVEPYVSQLQDLGIEVIYPTAKQPGVERQVRERAFLLDAAWICRPHLFGQYLALRENQPDLRFIYDTIDLHFVRLKREAELAARQGKAPGNAWRTYRHLELAYARLADMTVTASAADQEILRRYGISTTWVVPTIHPRYPGAAPPFEARQGVLFIGGYQHPPNVDAVEWLCREIMPIVWRTHPDVKVTLLGADPPAAVLALQSERVTVPGYQEDVSRYFLNSRVFAAPIRFGAGMNGKIGQSISFGLPTVTTPIGAGGVGLTHGANALVAADAASFAAQIIELYTQPDLWAALSHASLDHVARFEPAAIRDEISRMLSTLLHRK